MKAFECISQKLDYNRHLADQIGETVSEHLLCFCVSTFSTAAEWQDIHLCELNNEFFVFSDSLCWIGGGTEDLVTSVLISESHELICKKQKLFQCYLPRFRSCEYWNMNNM